jgi:hypothetical protein
VGTAASSALPGRRRHRGEQSRDDVARSGEIGDAMQHGDKHHGHRPAEVEGAWTRTLDKI